MRIIIELEGHSVPTVQVKSLVASGEQQAIDGGAPRAALLQALGAGGMSLSSEPGGDVNAGAPPEWLIESVENRNAAAVSATKYPLVHAPSTGTA